MDCQAEEKTVGMLRPRGYVYTWGSADAIGLATGATARGDVMTVSLSPLVRDAPSR